MWEKPVFSVKIDDDVINLKKLEIEANRKIVICPLWDEKEAS